MFKRITALILSLTFICCAGAVNAVAQEETQNTYSHYYKVFNVVGGTWEEAQAFCQSIGGYLVTVSGEEEQDGITELLKERGGLNCYWAGGRLVDGRWTWVTGEAFEFTNWATGEPNNQDGIEGYMELFGKRYHGGLGNKRPGAWNDASNSGASYAGEFYDIENTGFVCEWDHEPYYGIPYGDINLDGVVNNLDAAYALKHDADLISLDLGQRIRGDVTGDGIVNNLDAANILKYDAGLILSFRAEAEAE